MVRLGSGFSCVNLTEEGFSSNPPETGWYHLVCGGLVDDKPNGGWVLFYYELMLLQVMVEEFKNT